MSSTGMTLMGIAARFIAKSVVVGLAVAAVWMLAFPTKQPSVWIKVDHEHNIVCFVTDKGGIACLNVVLNT